MQEVNQHAKLPAVLLRDPLPELHAPPVSWLTMVFSWIQRSHQARMFLWGVDLRRVGEE